MKPAPLEALIGRRIRKLRQQQGWSLEAVAVKATISRSLLSKVENGRVSSPIATLANIATALHTSVGHLLGDENEDRCVVVRREQRKPAAGMGSPFGYSYEALGHKRIDKRMEPFIVSYPPGLEAAPRFSHRGEAFLYVLRGRIEFHHDTASFVLREGDSVYFDNEFPHGGRALGRGGAVALVVSVDG